MLERAVLLSESDFLERDDVNLTPLATLSPGSSCPPADSTSSRSSAIPRRPGPQASGNNQTQAAKLLGLNRDQIRYRIEKFGLGKTPP